MGVCDGCLRRSELDAEVLSYIYIYISVCATDLVTAASAQYITYMQISNCLIILIIYFCICMVSVLEAKPF